MGFLSVLSFAHKLAGERIGPGDCVVDATVGGGNDTLFLARAVGPKGVVFGFDIQEEALARTQARFIREGVPTRQVRLLHESHEHMEAAIPREFHGASTAVMFNLGYLPGGNHRLITQASTTLPALEAALRLLRPGGIVTIVVYPGHEGGDTEAEAVADWSAKLDQRGYQTLTYRFANQRGGAPYLIAVEKKLNAKVQ